MSYTVYLTETAKEDLREIAMWIAQHSKDVEIARKFVAELRDECKKLASFPDRGAYPRDRVLRSTGYRYIVYKDYVIFYLIEGSAVKIMAIFNGKKDYLRVMGKFV